MVSNRYQTCTRHTQKLAHDVFILFTNSLSMEKTQRTRELTRDGK